MEAGDSGTGFLEEAGVLRMSEWACAWGCWGGSSLSKALGEGKACDVWKTEAFREVGLGRDGSEL